MKKSKWGFAALTALLLALIAGAAALYPKLTAQMAQMDAASQQAATEATAAPAVTAVPMQEEESAQAESTPEVAGPVRRYMAADITVYDDAGTSVSLSGFRGKPVVVNFFASWCGPCKHEMPYFEEFYQAYGDQVEFMMVNLCAFGNDTKDAAKKMIEEGGYTFPVYFDTDGDAAIKYAVRSMPTTLFVSAEGELKGQKIGMIDRESLRLTVEAMAKEVEKK